MESLVAPIRAGNWKLSHDDDDDDDGDDDDDDHHHRHRHRYCHHRHHMVNIIIIAASYRNYLHSYLSCTGETPSSFFTPHSEYRCSSERPSLVTSGYII